ncbi:hypothetical protein EMIHUDRAFT_199372 [Emiliania huxleyi CCMP1516]|uniref:Uncharacterized protein n=2 Tax=Emiliania huxleyi TaxID=2903 RepID=A0A0D3KZG8_EMIH1|nr:hypothetical protein EMIHUDRAFT_199372 [Emiliania huxleyi CCMP1516]EOD41153.1 hypothetical protein EMIHUDRAFT_199372 [Emiliania huxleyi CCMP1516]|eukprot:XP_005793582.1 hypothetical protein EMIHUDRAFT_199372 [Emiliania huxleyi CCMP1516]
MLLCPFARRPSSRKKRSWHSRRWEINPERLRRVFAKLPEPARAELLDPDTLTQLVAEGAVHAALLGGGMDAAEADRVLRRKLSPPFLAAALAFFREALAGDERTPPVLPRELVYHQVLLPLPPSMDPQRQVDPDAAALVTVARACKLPRERQPREARDARRQNRVLRQCDGCGAYKSSVEFYACCLHDEQRVCRVCMLARPAEPFGEHLTEERRTAPVAIGATASVAGALLLRSTMVLGAGGAFVLALWLFLTVLLPVGVAQLHAVFPSLFGAEEQNDPSGASAGAPTASLPDATGAADVGAKEAPPSFFELTANTRAALGVAGAALLPSITLLGSRGTLAVSLWIAAAILLPLGVARLHALCPSLFGMVAGDPQRWLFETSAKSMEKTLVSLEGAPPSPFRGEPPAAASDSPPAFAAPDGMTEEQQLEWAGQVASLLEVVARLEAKVEAPPSPEPPSSYAVHGDDDSGFESESQA